MFKLVKVRPLPNYRLHLEYSDGVAGDVDLSSHVGKGVFHLWDDVEAFQNVSIGSAGEVRWNDEVDLCADALYMEITGKTPEEVFPALARINFEEYWPFWDPKNVAVFTTSQVLRLRQPILYVSHDEEDDSWQFHTGAKGVSVRDAMLVFLSEIVNYDPGICELADLPCGWYAERDSLDSPWKRARKMPLAECHETQGTQKNA